MAAAPPTASGVTPTLILRTKADLQIIGDATSSSPKTLAVIPGSFTECPVEFSPDGRLLATAMPTEIVVVDTMTMTVAARIPESSVNHALFVPCREIDDAAAASPLGWLLMSHRPMTPSRTDGNVVIWRVHDGSEVLRMVQSKWPAFHWTTDGQFAVRSIHTCIHVHAGRLWSSAEPVSKLAVELPVTKSPVLAMCPTPTPLCGIFVPAHKSNQAMARIVRLPTLSDDVLVRNLGKADDASLSWSKSGSALLVLAKSDTDRTGQSYYGSAALTLLNVRERQCYPVVLGRDDSSTSIHDVQWSPTADEFIVIHAAMPNNKATLFNAKGEALCQFGDASPRNLASWSPNGRLLAIGGAGNLAGDFQFYDRSVAVATEKRSPATLGSFSEKNSLYFWSPCSRVLVAANVFSRLRISNKYVLWKHSGERLAEVKFDELHEAVFLPVPASAFPVRSPSPVKVTAAAKPQAYRPPHQSAAAAALLARPTSSSSAHVKPATTGPIGSAVVVEDKKKRRR